MKTVFTTPRLNVYLLDEENKHYVIDLYSRPENIEFLEGIDVLQDIALSIKCYDVYDGIGAYLFFENNSNKFVGIGGIQMQEAMSDGSLAMKDSDIEFLILTHKEFCRQGYASEFCQAFFAKCFAQFPDLVIPARVNKENFACLKLLQKFGFKPEGEIDYHIYGNRFALLKNKPSYRNNSK